MSKLEKKTLFVIQAVAVAEYSSKANAKCVYQIIN